MDVLFTRALMVVSATATLLSGMLFLEYATTASQQPVYAAIPQALIETPAVIALPRRLEIPSINIDALIEHVGITPSGEMGVPKSRATVGWLETGPRPGERGSAVIAGHYGQSGAEKSVFDNLHMLQPGDAIYSTDADGVTTTFIVRAKSVYNPYDDATAVFSAPGDASHLNLITCDGVWDAQSQSYQKRLVIFADRYPYEQL
ncbi:MAG: class F sortase [Patescibacteria group bacterium]